MQLESPFVLLFLLLLPALWLLMRRRRATPTLRVSSVALYAAAGSSWRTRFRAIPSILRFAALALLLLALARPREGTERMEDNSNGVAIEMVLDRSGSMSEEFTPTGNRLDAAKSVFRDFVLGGRDLPGRPSDLVGVISFARYADTISPLTLDHQTMPEFLRQITLAENESEDGTAIMDALSLAAARLHAADEELKKRELLGKSPDNRIKSKIIILLTDGLDNRSRTPPAQVVDLCKKWGVRIYTIGIGDPEGGQRYITTPMGRIAMPTGPQIDSNLLEYLAKQTGGTFYLAKDGESLKEIYATIDRLEKSEIESRRYYDYAEQFMPLALTALGLLLIEALLCATVFRTTP